ncbi:hypothetical protein [Laceyella putida]|uniref:Uncharacterized protein n=1 Tax=Laceyella putida TaxID=110101 RepID=A0ABW2RRD2_9BACL
MKGVKSMKIVRNDLMKVIPIVGLSQKKAADEKENNGFKSIVDEMFIMKNLVNEEGFSPSFSYKLMKDNGKIHTYLNVIDHDTVQKRVRHAVYEDLGGCRFSDGSLKLSDENVTAFIVSSADYFSLNFDLGSEEISKLFALIGSNEKLLYNVTVQERVDNEEVKNQLLSMIYGEEYTATNESQEKMAPLWKSFFTEAELKSLEEKAKQVKDGYQAVRNGWAKVKGFVKRTPVAEMVDLDEQEKQRELPHKTEKQKAKAKHFAEVQIMFLLWTENDKKKDQFQRALERWAAELQGDTIITVSRFEPDMKKIEKGYIDPTQPLMMLYRRELVPLMWMPTPDQFGKEIYHEQKLKTEIADNMLTDVLGSLPFARHFNTREFIAFPPYDTRQQLDDRVKTMLLSGGQGGGKTTFIINQIIETFALRAKSREEWRKHAKSVVAFDVADGEMFREIMRYIPDWLQDRVIFLNHADFENPVQVGFHDLLKLNRETLKRTGYETEIANMDTQMLLDTIGDDSKVQAIEVHLMGALQASYAAGEGNIIDAIKILRDETYRKQIFHKLDRKKHVMIRVALANYQKEYMKDSATILKTIDNRILQVMNYDDLTNSITQPHMEEIDFWKWTMGDENGPYLVLIFLPSGSLQETTFNYLFAHYFLKLWKLMKFRDIINEDDRPETLIIVDEIHQIMNHKVVVDIFPSLFKEPRKYRFRYVMSLHGLSSIQGTKKKETIESIKNNRCNFGFFVGGEEMFNEFRALMEPYDSNDFNHLANLEYCALFSVMVNKKSQVFLGRLLEPPSMRMEPCRELDLMEFRNIKNRFGRPVDEVRGKRVEIIEKVYDFSVFDDEEKEGEKGCNIHEESLGKVNMLI